MSATDRDPFILDRPTGRRLSARDALVCVAVTAVLLLLVEGGSLRSAGEKMNPGIQRTAVLAVGEPAGWLADRLPIASAADSVTGVLSPDEELTGPGGFDAPAAGGSGSGEGPAGAGAARAGAPPVTAESFDAAELGGKPVRLPALKTLLVTGDSLAQPLDLQLAQRLSADGVGTIRDAHLGTGISKSELVDWGRLSSRQVRQHRPEAVVFFLGANEGFPMPAAGGRLEQCCGPAWAALYATRARKMMETYRRGGAARVYWIAVPLPREVARQRIARTVNTAVAVAAQPYRAHVRVLDMTGTFTPGGRYRAAMPVGGDETIVRESDGIHLNEAGTAIAADLVIARLRADFDSLR